MNLALEAPSPKQVQFYKAATKHVGFGGARGGGKSHAVRTKAVLLAFEYPGIRMLIVRRTYPGPPVGLCYNHLERRWSCLMFYEWCQRSVNRDTPTGDLARDMNRDKDSPFVENTKDTWWSHIRHRGGDSEVLRAFNTAWASYQRYLKSHPDA